MLRLEPVFKALVRPFIQLMNLKSLVVIFEPETVHGKLVVSVGEETEEILHYLSSQLGSHVESEKGQDYMELPWGSASLLCAPFTNNARHVGYAVLVPKENLEVFTEEEKKVLALTVPMLAAVISISELYLGVEEINERLVNVLGKLNLRLGKGQKLLHEELIQVREDERAYIAADLHDGPLQKVLNLIQKIESDKYDKDEIESLALQLASELRETTSHLHLPILDDLGIAPALKWLIYDMTREINLSTSLVLNGLIEEERFPPAIELALFRIAEESIRNAIKHSECSSLSIYLSRDDNYITLQVKDNGKGFPSESRVKDGSGILGMKTRVLQMRGSITVSSTCKQGTTIIAHIPLG
jgi:signal transduction histidine kinase